MNIASIRKSIAEVKRIDYSNFAIHHKLRACMDNAPILKSHDYDSLLSVINSWFIDDNFRYSQLDRWIESGITIGFSEESFMIKGDKHAWNLKYNSGVCCNLALKCKIMIEILYPWAQPLVAEKKSWRDGGSNHYFILLPTKGVNYGGQYIETNSYFVPYHELYELHNMCTHYQLLGDVYVIDPTRSFIGLKDNHELYHVVRSYNYLIRPDLVMTKQDYCINLERKGQEDYNFTYVHRFENEEFGSLTLGFNNKHYDCPVWRMGNDQYNFDNPHLVSHISLVDKDAAAKVQIIQNRGYRRL